MNYSPPILMWLETESLKVPVCRVGTDTIELSTKAKAAPGEATLHICVDGEDSQSQIYLPDGLRMDSVEHRFSALDVALAA